MKLYRYTFNNDISVCSGMYVKEEEYVTTEEYLKSKVFVYNKYQKVKQYQYVVLSKETKHYINEDDFGKLKNKTIYLKERDDKKAIELMTDYINKRLEKIRKDEQYNIKLLEYITNNPFKEGES